MTKIKLQKKTINSGLKSQDKSLSIQFSLDGFSFCITDQLSKKPICFTQYSFGKTLENPQVLLDNIKIIFRDETDLQQNFSSIISIHKNRLSCLVPSDFFDENNMKSYLDYNIKTLPTDYITFDDLEAINTKNVYIPYVNINNYLFQHFGEFEYKHHSTVLIDKFIEYSKSVNKVLFFVNVSKKQLDIVVTKDKKLLLYNTFEFETKEDFCYYILFTSNQLGLNPDEFTLLFAGDIDKDSQVYKIVYQYVNNIDFVKNTSKLFDGSSVFPNHSNYILVS